MSRVWYPLVFGGQVRVRHLLFAKRLFVRTGSMRCGEHVLWTCSMNMLPYSWTYSVNIFYEHITLFVNIFYEHIPLFVNIFCDHITLFVNIFYEHIPLFNAATSSLFEMSLSRYSIQLLCAWDSVIISQIILFDAATIHVVTFQMSLSWYSIRLLCAWDSEIITHLTLFDAAT